MSIKKDNHISEEHYISKAWLKKYGSADIPENDTLHIIDPFPSAPITTQGIPKKTPALTFDTLEKAITILKRNLIIRFEVNQELFDEICARIKTSVEPKFRLINPYSILYERDNSIPIILIPDQIEPLKIIKTKEIV